MLRTVYMPGMGAMLGASSVKSGPVLLAYITPPKVTVLRRQCLCSHSRLTLRMRLQLMYTMLWTGL